MEVKLKENLLNNLNIIIKYQNCILLKLIARENNWSYEELKKKYLKIKVKKEEKKNEQNNMKETNFVIKKKIVLKKKNNKKCYLFDFDGKDYYVNPDNNNSYDIDGNFVGIKEEDVINFDMEEAE